MLIGASRGLFALSLVPESAAADRAVPHGTLQQAAPAHSKQRLVARVRQFVPEQWLEQRALAGVCKSTIGRRLQDRSFQELSCASYCCLPCSRPWRPLRGPSSPGRVPKIVAPCRSRGPFSARPARFASSSLIGC